MATPHDHPGPHIFQHLDQVNPFPYKLSEYIRRAAWEMIGAPLVSLSPRKAHGWRRFWLRQFGATMQKTSYVKNTTKVRHPWLLTMGHHSCLAENVEVYNLGPIVIGDHSVVSQHTYLCAGTHDFTRWSMPLVTAPITIGENAWLGADVFVGPGVTVGELCVVGARSVVVKDLPARQVCAGNPCRPLRPRPEPV